LGLPDGDRLSHQRFLRTAETFPRSVMDLPDERMTADRTCAEVIRAMADPQRGTMHGPFVGITMMGPGADQIFARVVLETGGHLYVVMPTLGSQYLDVVQYARDVGKPVVQIWPQGATRVV
jgi:hypothetical protein